MENQIEYIIEKNIPVPPRAKFRKGRYPFREMEVGDSFTFNLEYSRENMSLASNAGRSWGKTQTPVKKFIVRKTEDNRIRIWRIE